MRRRVVTARQQAELLSPWVKTADDNLTQAPPAVDPRNDAGLVTSPPLDSHQPPTITDIPREDFDKILAPKGVTYDQHLDNLESHFNAATADQARKGRVWYRAGGDILRDIANKFGISIHRAIAVGAALSSRTDWNNNLHFAGHLIGRYRPGQNEDEWQRANIHPSALARYMEEKHGIVPGEKAEDDLTNPAHFSIKELKQLHQAGFMPRTKADFKALAKAHGGNHWQYNPEEIEPRTGQKGRWVNAPLRGFEELQTPEGRDAWLRNAQMSMRGGLKLSPNKWGPSPRRKKGDPPPKPQYRQRWEDTIDGHLRQVRDSTSPYGFSPTSAYTGAGVPTLGGNIDKAKLLMQVPEDEFDKHLNGQKYRAFFANLSHNLRFRKARRAADQGYYDLGGRHWTELGPEYLRSTIDTQHMRAASQPHGSDEPAPGYKESSVVTEPQYQVYQQGLIDLTHRINSRLPRHRHLLPHQVQAIIWGKFKDDMSALKPSAGQTFWTPELHDIQPFADRYSHLKTAFTHIHPRLLEPDALDPYVTDSDDWFDAAMASWEQNHQHELAEGAPIMTSQARRELNAARQALAAADSVLNQQIPAGVADVLSYSASLIKRSIPEHLIGTSYEDNPEWADRLFKHVQENPDGMTFKHEPGDGPTGGQMVSYPKKEVERVIPFDELTPKHLHDYYVKDFGRRINELDDNFGGGWKSGPPSFDPNNPEDVEQWGPEGPRQVPHYYMDVSRSHGDPWEGAQAAVTNRQDAIYDLAYPDYEPPDRIREVPTPQYLHDQIAKGGSRDRRNR